MIDIFRVASSAPQDKSLEYLAQLFGLMHGVIWDPSGRVTGNVTLLSTLFKTFNTVALAIGVLIIVYVIVTSVLKTAHEGEAMGRQGSALWTPIRIVLGIAGLFPMSSGYCAIQIIIMWVIVQGIGAADSLWSVALNYMNELGSPFVQATVPTTGVSTYLESLYAGLACDATLREGQAVANTGNIGNYYCNKNPKADFCATLDPRNMTAETLAAQPNSQYPLGPNGDCGKLTYCNKAAACATTNSLSCKLCEAQQVALADIIKTEATIAYNLQQADFDYRQFYYDNQSSPWMTKYCSDKGIATDGCCLSADPQSPCQRYTSSAFPNPNNYTTNGLDPQNANNDAITNLFWPNVIKPNLKSSSDFINILVDYYSNAMTETITTYVTEQSQDNQKLNGVKEIAASNGWIFAGAFYYTIGNAPITDNQNTTYKADGTIESTGVGKGADTSNPNKNYQPTLSYSSSGTLPADYNNIRVNDKAAATLLAIVSQQQSSGTSSSGSANGNETYSSPLTSSNSQINVLVKPIAGVMADIQRSFSAAIRSGSNPMFVIQNFGMTMLVIVEVFFGVFLLITLILGIAGNFSGFVIGTGIINPVGPAMALVYMVLLPALYGFMGIMAAYGGLLGIYIPLIPFMVFTGGAITWFLLVIEAIVAGPIIALGIIMPSGHHEVMGKAEPALLMLLNIFLRPSLMILGMLAGMLLSAVLLKMIFYTFWQIAIPASSGSSTSLVLSWIFYLGAFIALVSAVVNKSYATIYLLPERVITWIGGHAGGLGVEQEMEREGKGAVEGAGRGIGGAASQVGQTPKSQAEGARNLEIARQKRAKAAAKDAQTPAIKGEDDKGGGGGGDVT